MAYNIIRPRRGIKSLWETYKSRIYKNGEMLVESPETGIGSGPVNVKFGDGVTDYEHLPYGIMAPISEVNEASQAPVNSTGVLKAIQENASVPEDVLSEGDVVDNLSSTSTKLPLSAKQGKELNDKISTMQTNFQAGVDAIYNKCVTLGSTPSSKTPSAIATAMDSLRKVVNVSGTLNFSQSTKSADGGSNFDTITFPVSGYKTLRIVSNCYPAGTTLLDVVTSEGTTRINGIDEKTIDVSNDDVVTLKPTVSKSCAFEATYYLST